MVKNAADIIDLKGGPTKFAEAVGKPALTVRMWKHRNHFPRVAWPEIISAYPDITMEALLKMEKRRGSQPHQGVAA